MAGCIVPSSENREKWGTRRIGSYAFNHRSDHRFFALGRNGTQGKYEFLRSLGWNEQRESKKLRWLWVQEAKA
jgi:hypothetical protein